MRSGSKFEAFGIFFSGVILFYFKPQSASFVPFYFSGNVDLYVFLLTCSMASNQISSESLFRQIYSVQRFGSSLPSFQTFADETALQLFYMCFFSVLYIHK